MRKKINFLIGSLMVASVFLLSHCTKSSDVVVVVDPHVLKLGTSTTLGSYLTDKDGNALYFFVNDADGANNCTGGCIANWPIFMPSGLSQAKLGPGLTLADFDSITSANGKQLTYKGWPLYYYAPGGVREASGKTTGEAVGGVWFVAKPDYSIMIANYQLLGINGKNYTVSPTNIYTEGLGKSIYFTDAKGRTLYIFANDYAKTNNYTTTDATRNAVWPIYYTKKRAFPSNLDKTLFDSITTVLGDKQLTYNGWPIYYYGPDVDGTTLKYRGINKGVSVGASATAQTKWPILFKEMPAARPKP